MTPSPVNVGRATAPHRDDEVGRSDTKRKKEIRLYVFKTKIKEL